MKLRIRGNSLRVRLLQSEVALLGRGLPVEEITEFGPDVKLITQVVPTPSVGELTATFGNDVICIHVPIDQASFWADGDEVGIESVQAIENDRSLKIVIEKDFACLHRDDEVLVDAFPNPRQSPSNG